jgi:hypothetical protein
MNNRSSEDPRWAGLRPPATAGSPLTRRRFLAGAGIILTGPALIASCGSTRADRGEAQPANTTRVHFGLIDAQIGKPTPAMAKIESEFLKGDDARSLGTRERLQKAKAFYIGLRGRMSR